MKRSIQLLSCASVAAAILLSGCVPLAPLPIAATATSPPSAPTFTPELTVSAAEATPTSAPSPMPPVSTPGPAASASPVPPAASPGSKPLSAILRSVEERGLGSITEADFDDGLWEVTVCTAAACQKLYLDPRTGEEVRRRNTDLAAAPPAGALPLSTIVQSVEALGLGVIEEVEFEHGAWEFELHKDGREIELVADPLTGQIRR